MHTPDGTLVRDTLRGRTEAFGELVDRHAPAVFRLVRSTIHQPADAEDLAQDVFLSAYRTLKRLREPDRFRAYLLSIAGRRILDFLRRRKVRSRIGSLENAGEVADRGELSLDRRLLLRSVEEVVAKLPPRSRLVFALRHHEGLSCKQIARVLEESAGSVYSRLSRTHAAIRKVLARESG